MQRAFFYIGILLLLSRCQSAGSAENPVPALVASATTTIPSTEEDTTPALKPYAFLEYDNVELLRAAPGTKSVLFNTSGTKLYAMNLEGLSIYEFDQSSRKV